MQLTGGRLAGRRVLLLRVNFEILHRLLHHLRRRSSSPRRARVSVASTMKRASTSKKSRSAARLSLRPKPSVPSSAAAAAASDRSPPAAPSCSRRRRRTRRAPRPRHCVTYGTRGCLAGMQHVPALGGEPVAIELVVAGHAPHVGRDVVLLLEDLLRLDHLAENGAAAEQLRLQLRLLLRRRL